MKEQLETPTSTTTKDKTLKKTPKELQIDEIIEAESSEEDIGPLKSQFTYVTDQPVSPLGSGSKKGAMYYSGNQSCRQELYTDRTCYQTPAPPVNPCYYPPGYHQPGCHPDRPNYYPSNPNGDNSRGSKGCWTCIQGLLACTLCIACLKCCCCCCDCDFD